MRTNLNRFFSVSLETQEVRDIAYSLSTWTWARPALNHAPEVQAARGRRSGQSRRDAKAGRNLTIRDLKDDGWTVEDIAAIIGIHRSTVYRVMKSASRYLDTNRVNVARTCSGGGSPGGDMSMGKQTPDPRGSGPRQSTTQTLRLAPALATGGGGPAVTTAHTVTPCCWYRLRTCSTGPTHR